MSSQPKVLELHYRGALRRCPIVGYCGRHGDRPVGLCVMPSTGTTYLVVEPGKQLSRSGWNTFDPTQDKGRDVFLTLVRSALEARRRWLVSRRNTHAGYLVDRQIAAKSGDCWSEIDRDSYGRRQAARVVTRSNGPELHVARLDDDEPLSSIKSWSIQYLRRQEESMEAWPQTEKESQREIQKLERLLERHRTDA